MAPVAIVRASVGSRIAKRPSRFGDLFRFCQLDSDVRSSVTTHRFLSHHSLSSGLRGGRTWSAVS